MSDAAETVTRTTTDLIGAAVNRSALYSKEGIAERLFTLAFSGLVYPQIWEDPVVDLEALALEPTSRVWRRWPRS